jgi:phosphoglycolate phosphatase|tara:strand:- start:186 stop:836 length:651 start_codon:yes stop_codon:yes gene_type:complete
MGNFKYMLFDLDGTLVDSGPDLLEALNYILKKNNLEPIDDYHIGNLVGGGAEVMIKRGFNFYNKEISLKKLPLLIKEFLNYYKDNCSVYSKPYHGVSDTLKFLNSKKYKLAVCTNKSQILAEKVLKELKLDRYFDLILGSSTKLKMKPDTEMLSYCIDFFGTDTDKTIMVGDTFNDIIPSNKLKMKSIYVEYGYSENQDINATFKIKKFQEILKYI